MKTLVITSLLLLSCSTIFASTVTKNAMTDDVNIILKAAQEVRKLHIATEMNSIVNFNTVGSVQAINITDKGTHAEIIMAYSGPAVNCESTVIVRANSVDIVATQCAE